MGEIKHGHRHHMVPVSVRPRPDGGSEAQLRCQTRIVEDNDAKIEQTHAGCGLEARARFDAEGAPTEVAYRFGGVWFDGLFLARLMPMPTGECEECGGDGCEGCASLGLTLEDGRRVESPPLKVVS